ncbi:MAG: T9SS type A sorting domain-containing protein [Sphingobacteriaceae bacterium]|nr:T9SS type A sorting domain-containing protein [Sphingobacteriaceae bacterium]
MKKLVLLFISSCTLSYAQQGPVAAGTSTTGAGGSISYSIGQIDYIYPSGTGSSSEGLQQPYEVFVTEVSENLNSVSINVFPNPTSQSVIIDFKAADFKNHSYQLTDVNGKLISENKITESQSKINVTEMSSGIYFISISNSSSSLKTFKLIKH